MDQPLGSCLMLVITLFNRVSFSCVNRHSHFCKGETFLWLKDPTPNLPYFIGRYIYSFSILCILILDTYGLHKACLVETENNHIPGKWSLRDQLKKVPKEVGNWNNLCLSMGALT